MQKLILLLAWAACGSAAASNLFELATRGVDLNKVPLRPTNSPSSSTAPEDVVVTYSYKQDASGRFAADRITAVAGVSALVPGCAQRYLDGKLEEVSYSNGRLPTAILVANTNSRESEFFELPDLQQRTAAADHAHLRSFFKRNARVFVTYQVCGASGRTIELRDIYTK